MHGVAGLDVLYSLPGHTHCLSSPPPPGVLHHLLRMRRPLAHCCSNSSQPPVSISSSRIQAKMNTPARPP